MSMKIFYLSSGALTETVLLIQGDSVPKRSYVGAVVIFASDSSVLQRDNIVFGGACGNSV